MNFFLKTSFFLTIAICSSQNGASNWESHIDFGNGTVFTTFLTLEEENGLLVFHSPDNADVRLFGALKAKLARAAGKSPKEGVLMKLTASRKGDSIFGETFLPVFGELDFKGYLSKEHLSGVFAQNDTIYIGTLEGKISKKERIDFTSLYPEIIEITKNNIYSKNIFETRKWKKFKKKLKNLSKNAQDDIEFFIGFNMLNSNLPFSHYNLFIGSLENNVSNEEAPTETSTIEFEEKNKNTAYLKIKNFGTSQNDLEKILPKIIKKNYNNLIVDLRDNAGGGIEAAFEFAKHIVKKKVEVGYFVTKNMNYNEFEPLLFDSLPELQPKTTEEFGEELKSGKGAKLIFQKPNNEVFGGNLYVLTNKNTASTCEPIVYILKHYNWATIIGEKTAGAMLAAFPFIISDKYILSLPIADFYTSNGLRLDQVGVIPDIETDSDKALEKALELIKRNR
jgi:Peptidase family S41